MELKFEQAIREMDGIIVPMVNALKDRASFFRLDLSVDNPRQSASDVDNAGSVAAFIRSEQALNGGRIPIGGYLEDRLVYRRSAHFGSGSDARTIHLGVDIWLSAGEPVYSPLDGRIHSIRNNIGYGNYGPTIVVEYQLEDYHFYGLFGHLATDDLNRLNEGQSISAGSLVARIGVEEENGNWPPHLHFQLIRDMGDWKGDFPGVCHPDDLSRYRLLCPDPSPLLGLNF